MDGLLDNAKRLMEALRDATANGGGEDWTVFVGPEGSYQMIASYDGTLESLSWSRGARMAWRARKSSTELTVEGYGYGERCRLVEPFKSASARRFIGEAALYQMA